MGTEDDPLSFLRLETIFGDLASNGEFTALYSEMIKAIYEDSDIAQQMQKIRW
jgi:mannitol 2-dehydrogenase